MKILKKVIEYGLYVLVFLLPIQTRLIIREFTTGPQGTVGWGFVEYPSIGIYGIDILLMVLLLLFFTQFLIEFKKGVMKPIPLWQWLLAAFDFFIFISLLFSFDKILSLYRYFLFLLGTGLFFLIVRAEYNRNKLFLTFFSAIFLQSLLAIWQFLSQKTFAFKWLGLASHLPIDLGTSVVEVSSKGERWLRAYGGFDHPNILGGAVAIGLVIFVWLFVKEKIKIKAAYYYLLFTVCFLGLIFSFSRSSWGGFTLALLFILAVCMIKKDWRAQTKILKTILLSVVLFAVIFFQYSDLFVTRLAGEGRLEIKSDYERSYFLNESRDIIKDNILFGTGIGNYTTQTIKERKNDYFWTFQPVHNTFLLVLAEIGIFGFLFFTLFLAWIVFYSFEKKEFLNLSILIILFIIMLYDHWLWSLHFGIMFFWLVMGLLFKNIKFKKYVQGRKT